MKKLEESKYFPHIAWITVVSFALFTYNLTLRVQDELNDINSGIEDIDARLDRIEQSVSKSAQERATSSQSR